MNTPYTARVKLQKTLLEFERGGAVVTGVLGGKNLHHSENHKKAKGCDGCDGCDGENTPSPPPQIGRGEGGLSHTRVSQRAEKGGDGK